MTAQEQIAKALWGYFLGEETNPGVYDHDAVRVRIDGDIHIDELAEWIAKRLGGLSGEPK